RVGFAGADVPSRIAQTRKPNLWGEGVLGMARAKTDRARSATSIHQHRCPPWPRITHGTRNPAGIRLARGLLVHVAGFAIGLQGRRKLEGAAPEQVVRLVRGQQRAEAANIPETTSPTWSTWIHRSDVGKLGTAGKGLVIRRRRIADISCRRRLGIVCSQDLPR